MLFSKKLHSRSRDPETGYNCAQEAFKNTILDMYIKISKFSQSLDSTLQKLGHSLTISFKLISSKKRREWSKLPFEI